MGFAALLAGSLLQAETQSPASYELLLDEAASFVEKGSWEAALGLLDLAREVDGGDADLHFLASKAMLGMGRSWSLAIAELDAALASRRFTRFSAGQALIERASLLQRRGRPREALADLAAAGAGRAGSLLSLDAAAAALSLACRRDLADREAFNAELDRALSRFPRDPRFPRLFLTWLNPSGPSPAERKIGDQILRNLPGYLGEDPELAVLAASIMPSPQARREAILSFRARGLASAPAIMAALETGILDGAQAIDEFFSLPGSLDLDALRRLDSLLASDEHRSLLAARLSAFSGALRAPVAPIGGGEERAIYDSGEARSWTVDLDQDGVAEIRASMLPGLSAVTLTMEQADGVLTLAYENWPAIAQASGRQASTRTEYLFPPEALYFKAFSLESPAPRSAPWFSFPRHALAAPPSQRALLAAALSMTLEEDGKDRVIVELSGGVAIRSRRYRQGQLVAEMSYSGGRPFREKVDSDGDGAFETERLHDPAGAGDDASVTAVGLDLDGDGLVDYREETRSPYLREWDYNGDGLMDAREYREAGDRIVRSFSGKLDGFFDETLVIREGKILSFTRDGEALRFIADSNPRLRWIGSKIFDLGSRLPPREGLYRQSNQRYRLVYVGEDAFAELIP
jgi:tetratricopeptide (TPR) repeat protein